MTMTIIILSVVILIETCIIVLGVIDRKNLKQSIKASESLMKGLCDYYDNEKK